MFKIILFLNGFILWEILTLRAQSNQLSSPCTSAPVPILDVTRDTCFQNSSVCTWESTINISTEFYYNAELLNKTTVMKNIRRIISHLRKHNDLSTLIVSLNIPDEPSKKASWNYSDFRHIKSISGIVFSSKPNKISVTDLIQDVNRLKDKALSDIPAFNSSATIPVGFGYSADFIGLYEFIKEVYSNSAKSFANFTKINVQFSTSNFVLSYGMFKSYMENLTLVADKNSNSLTKKRCEIYHIQMNESNDVNYSGLLSQYATAWAKESKRKVISDTTRARSKVGKDIKRIVIPTFKFLNFKDRSRPNYDAHGCKTSECDNLPYREMITNISRIYESLLMSFDIFQTIQNCWNDKENLTVSSDLKHVYINFQPNGKTLHKTFKAQVENALTQDINKTSIAPKKTILLNSTDVDATDTKKVCNMLINKWTGSKVVSFGCVVDLSNAMTSGSNLTDYLDKNRCKHIFDSVTVFVWKFTIYLHEAEFEGYSYKYFEEKVQNKFDNIFKVATAFLVKHNKKIFLWVTAVPPNSYNSNPSLYCHSNTMKMSYYYEAIANWASLRKVGVILKEAYDLGWEPGWLHAVVPPPGITFLDATVVLTENRNIPETPESLKKNQCIEPSDKVPLGGIQFDLNKTGTSVDLNIKNESFTVDELQQLLLLPISKFKMVEILFRENYTDVNKVITSLKHILPGHDDYYSIYLQFPIGNLENSQSPILEMVAGALEEKVSIAGVHISGLNLSLGNETSAIKGLKNLKNIKDVPFGLVVENCATEITRYQAMKCEKNKTFNHSYRNYGLGYIVCKEQIPAPTIGHEYQQEISRLLDGHLVVRHALQKWFSKVYFRLDGFRKNERTNEIENLYFLKVVRDVVEFSSIYNMNYFAFPAFDNIQSDAIGWWEITNFKDLGNLSVYLEKESDYLNRSQPIQPIQPIQHKLPPENIPKDSQSNPVIIIGFVILSSVILGFAIISVVLWLRSQNKHKILTDTEVVEFFEGSSVYYTATVSESPEYDGNVAGVSDGEAEYISLKFNEEYNLPKKDFKIYLTGILGTGNFGSVYRAEVRGRKVAVKMPQSSCSKDTFRSMLQEVKVLSFIGEHVNVLAFVGSYTKEIQKGIIYIATELCENGSLKSFLRKKACQTKGALYENVDQIAIKELIRFCCEISAGMEFIAARRVIHGDLSLRNVLLDENYTCKIGDFGMSRKLYEYNNYVKKNQEPMPWRWMALESLKFMEFTTKSDVWSYGVTVWEIFTFGEVPYGGHSWSFDFRKELENGLRLTKPQLATDEVYDQLQKCWEVDPHSRPNFVQMHLFFKGLYAHDEPCG